MRTSELLVESSEFTIRRVTCAGGHARWSSPEPGSGFGVVLVRSGVFRLRDRGREILAEPTTGYVQGPDSETQFAHPAGGDVCTVVTVAPALWQIRPLAGTAGVRIDARAQLAHLRVLRAAATDDADFAVPERLVRLLGQALAQTDAAETAVVSRAGERLAAAAAEAILAGDPAASRLTTLATKLGVSPYHLSRTFRGHTGMSLTRYRNRVRVSRALHRLDGGEADLARLAAELGFADQAHLTRTIRAEVDQPPSEVRRLLGGVGPRM